MPDFYLHAPKGANKKKRIIGRGNSSGSGGTAGRGGRKAHLLTEADGDGPR